MGNRNAALPGNGDLEVTEPWSATPESDSLHAAASSAWLPLGNATDPSHLWSGPPRVMGERWSFGWAETPGAPANRTLNSPRTGSSTPLEISEVSLPAES